MGIKWEKSRIKGNARKKKMNYEEAIIKKIEIRYK